MSTPLNDLASFLVADTADFSAFGAARYVILVVFYALAIASLTLVVVNLRDDRAQRSGRSLWMWLIRVLIGCLWFQMMLSTLPFGPDNGLHGGIEQMAERAAYPGLRQFASDVLLPNVWLVNPLVFLAEFGIATALMLGLFVRPVGFCAMVACLVAWLGFYGPGPGDAAVWPWRYVVVAMLCGTFSIVAAGRALGADAWLRRNVPSVRERRPAGLLLRLLT